MGEIEEAQALWSKLAAGKAQPDKVFAALDSLPANDAAEIGKLAGLGGKTDKAGFAPVVADFYQTNPIARASAVMAECSALAASSIRSAS